ncbi:MAG: hypothetical protein U0836_03705 [Pirellulales bacterium]
MRLRPRFSLRTLLVALSLLGILVGIAGRWWREDRRQRALVKQCLELLSAEGQVQVTHRGRDEVLLGFYGNLSLSSARELCTAKYVKCVEINTRERPLPADVAAALRNGFVQADPPSVAPAMWGRADYDRFARFVEDRGGKIPPKPSSAAE